jgi:hypothetical protein
MLWRVLKILENFGNFNSHEIEVFEPTHDLKIRDGIFDSINGPGGPQKSKIFGDLFFKEKEVI